MKLRNEYNDIIYNGDAQSYEEAIEKAFEIEGCVDRVVIDDAEFGKGVDLTKVNLDLLVIEGINVKHIELCRCDIKKIVIRSCVALFIAIKGCNFEQIEFEEVTASESIIISGCNAHSLNMNNILSRMAYITSNDIGCAILSRCTFFGGAIDDGERMKIGVVNSTLNRMVMTVPEENISYDDFSYGVGNTIPMEGSFVGYKRCRSGKIVTLLITEDAKRSIGTRHECRCSKAKVLKIEDKHGNNCLKAVSSYDPNFVYKVGEIVESDGFDEDRWSVCEPGIHFFIDKEMAKQHMV